MVAEAFSRPVFRALAQAAPPSRVQSAAIAAVVDQLSDSRLHEGATLGAAFDAAFEHLRRQYRCEYYFKSQIVSKVVFGRHSPRTASALLEFRMGSSIADLVIVNGTTTVYEIKTDLDDFDRLASQIEHYGSRAEFTNVVVSERRAHRAAGSVPRWVGVLAVRRSGAIATVRAAESRMEHLQAEHLFHLLRTEEARRAVCGTTGKVIDAPTGRAWALLRHEFASLTAPDAHAAVVAELRARGAVAGQVASSSDFPVSLRALAYAQPLAAASRGRLLAALAAPASTVRR